MTTPTNITQTPINIGPQPFVIRLEESVGLVTLLVALGIVAWLRRANAKGSK